MESVGAFGIMNIVALIISFVKEILLIFLIYKGIKALNIYIKKDEKKTSDKSISDNKLTSNNKSILDNEDEENND